jgi:hypothetical protein
MDSIEKRKAAEAGRKQAAPGNVSTCGSSIAVIPLALPH